MRSRWLRLRTSRSDTVLTKRFEITLIRSRENFAAPPKRLLSFLNCCDVVGGWVLGLAWLLGAVAAFEAWRHDEGKRRTHPLDEGVEPEAAGAIR